MPAFNAMELPLGSYQRVRLAYAANLGDQFTKSGSEPRCLSAVFSSSMDAKFEMRQITVLLTEEAQRHLIAALQSNLDDDARRAHELIVVQHPDFGRIE